MLKTQPVVEGRLARRIKTLITLVDQTIANEPWIKNSVYEAIDPLRKIK